MKVILEIDHIVSKEEITSWIEEVLIPNNPCVWGYSFEEHHCGSCQNSQLEEENAELKIQNENKREEIKMLRTEHKQDMAIHNNYVNKVEELKAQIENYKLSENESKEIIAELKSKLEKEQNLNKVIKERLVEVNCDCNEEKKQKCVMYPEYCEGERKTVVDLMTLVSDGLNETLIKQKEEQIEVKKLEILNLKAKIEKMKNCENCKWNFVIGDYEPCKKCSYEKDNWEVAE